VSDEHGQLLMRIALAEEIGLDLFPPEVREHLALLDPAAHDERALRRFVEEFEEREDEGAGEALKLALGALHAGVSQLAPGEALLVLVLF
jgi:hypothetical protein